MPNGRPRTSWTSSDIWLRTRFDFSPATNGEVKPEVYHDEDVEVFINGRQLLGKAGFVPRYEEFPSSKKTFASLELAGILIAVHCLETAGRQYIDVGVAQGLVILDSSETAGHDLLLNEPKE